MAHSRGHHWRRLVTKSRRSQLRQARLRCNSRVKLETLFVRYVQSCALIQQIHVLVAGQNNSDVEAVLILHHKRSRQVAKLRLANRRARHVGSSELNHRGRAGWRSRQRFHDHRSGGEVSPYASGAETTEISDHISSIQAESTESVRAIADIGVMMGRISQLAATVVGSVQEQERTSKSIAGQHTGSRLQNHRGGGQPQ